MRPREEVLEMIDRLADSKLDREVCQVFREFYHFMFSMEVLDFGYVTSIHEVISGREGRDEYDYFCSEYNLMESLYIIIDSISDERFEKWLKYLESLSYYAAVFLCPYGGGNTMEVLRKFAAVKQEENSAKS